MNTHHEPDGDPQDFWEQRYSQRQRVWSGAVNPTLAELASGLPVGEMLDLGCGEGGDLVWFASQGWRVSGVDISPTAVGRASQALVEAGLADQITTLTVADLGVWTPVDRYDLVAASFLQSPLPLGRNRIITAAAASIRPGGHLLVLSHAAPPPWAGPDHRPHQAVDPDQEWQQWGLGEIGWEALQVGTRKRLAVGPDGEPAELIDGVILAVRRG